ncbi:MAG: RluA family pseudouridine synthase [Acidobacteriota bacterium]|nr:RluA family pseudouridine synthase [Acidobacteriota bacterium]
MSNGETLHFQVEEASRRLRLDEFLFDKIRGVSKMYLRDLIKTEKCLVNGTVENRGYRLRANDFVEIELDCRVERAMKPEPLPLEIVYEDAEIIVVNKAAGMLMHPNFAQKTGTLLNGLSYYLNESPEPGVESREKESGSRFSTPKARPFIRPGLIHRLDRETSGLVVVAKTLRAHRILSDHFRRKLVEKKYFALVEGVVKEDSGVILAPIGRDAEIRLWRVREDGKHAETRFWVKERFSDSTLLELEPVTGRTNQLRVHCLHIGHPIVGDEWHSRREFPRLCLHAYKLSFWHPNGNRRMEFETESENYFT